MKFAEVFEEARKEFEHEVADAAKLVIKERLAEIGQAKKALAKMERQLQDLLDKDVE